MGFQSRMCRVFPLIRPNGLTLLNSDTTLRYKDEPTDVVQGNNVCLFDNLANMQYVGKSCGFFMLIGVIVTAELDGVRETYEEKKEEEKNETKIKDELKQNSVEWTR